MTNYKIFLYCPFFQGPGDQGTLNRGGRRRVGGGGQLTDKGQVTDDIIAQHPELHNNSEHQQDHAESTADGGESTTSGGGGSGSPPNAQRLSQQGDYENALHTIFVLVVHNMHIFYP